MRRTLVLDVVGLTGRMIGPDTPNLARLARRPLRAAFPALTCSAQATILTGTLPGAHGIVGNGWYFRDLAEVLFWRQSNHLVAGEKLWEAARRRDPAFTVAKLFWWYNMYSSADLSITPRPMYPADGRKLPDVYTQPPGLRDELQRELGTFPLFHFWGPNADLVSSRWIAEATKRVFERHAPTLSLVYLPHLDYDLQRRGPSGGPEAIAAIDALAGELIAMAEAKDARVIVLSEYGLTEVRGAVFPNRALREAGLLAVREELGRELLDAGASSAFAVADHQIAHVYVKDPERLPAVRACLERLDGVEAVHDREAQRALGVDHPRSGELLLVSRADRWFAYYHWLDDAKAPDYARTVDIHRKPGYDPVELFLDPAIGVPLAAIGWRLAKKKLGFRTLMDLIPLDPSLVRGSHGRVTDRLEDGPVLLSNDAALLDREVFEMTELKALVLAALFE